ncbi:unnamed protein product, partial [Ilex paraguariensis]
VDSNHRWQDTIKRLGCNSVSILMAPMYWCRTTSRQCRACLLIWRYGSDATFQKTSKSKEPERDSYVDKIA